jgi:hypothetical protein
MTVMKRYEASWDDESSHIEDLRLSVASLLRGDDNDWEEAEEMISEGNSAILVEGLEGKRTSRCWGLDVMSDIFETFGMEYANATWEEVDTPRGSLIAKRPGQITGEQDKQNKQEITPTHDENIGDVDASEQKQYVEIYDPTEIDLLEPLENEEPLHQREQLPAQVEYTVEEPKRHVFPLSPPESIEESSCIPCSPCSPIRSPIRFTNHLPTPPMSPGSIYSQPTSFIETHPYSDDCPECNPPASPKPVSLFHVIKARFRRQTSTPKMRSTNVTPVVSPSLPKSTPVSLKPAPPQRPMSSVTKASGDDLRALLRGPTLKLNRLSDISLPLSPEEREQIARKRATNPKGTEEFDLVVTLGTLRTPHPTPRPSISSKAEDMAMFNPDPSEIPPVPFIDPEYLINSPAASNLPPAETSRPASIKKPRRRMSRRLRNRRPALPKAQDDTARRSSGSGVRNVLSEENLIKLNSSTSRFGPPLPSPLQRLTDLIHPPMKGLESPFTTRRYVASQAAETNSTIPPLPLPPLSPGPKKRRHRYPTTEQFPLAQTTALGLKGGRVGVVQMGSPTKANKILGDTVLMVPEKDGRKRRTRVREATPSVASGSIAKVEKLRGERILVDSLHSPKEADAQSILIRPESKGAVWIV